MLASLSIVFVEAVQVVDEDIKYWGSFKCSHSYWLGHSHRKTTRCRKGRGKLEEGPWLAMAVGEICAP